MNKTFHQDRTNRMDAFIKKTNHKGENKSRGISHALTLRKFTAVTVHIFRYYASQSKFIKKHLVQIP